MNYGGGNMIYFSVESLNENLTFGKYNNEKTLVDIFVDDEKYAKWLLDAKGFDYAPGLKNFLYQSLNIKDKELRKKVIMEEYDDYMISKNKSKTKPPLDSHKQHTPYINTELLEQETKNKECEWEIVFSKEGKKRYCTKRHGVNIILEMINKINKETGKKEKQYTLQYENGKVIAGHSKLKRLSEYVELCAKQKKSYFEQKEKDLLSKYCKMEVKGPDIVVRSNMWNCINNHKLIDVAASFNLLIHKKNGELGVIESLEHAAYCSQCETFFIHESTYDSLKKRGYLMHRIISHKLYENDGEFDISNMAEESMLHYMGYNVSKHDDLSDEVRWGILENACNLGTMSKMEIVTFLSHLINTNGGKNNMDDAVGKWKMDRDHIQNYKINNLTKININNIKKKNYYK